MRYSELFEGRDAPLFHWLTNQKALHVFTNDAMPGLWEHKIDSQIVKGNSFSRNNKLELTHTPIRITVDQTKLAYHYKIIPLDGELTFYSHLHNKPISKLSLHIQDRKKQQYIVFAEEFIVGDIKNIHTYITEIFVNNDHSFGQVVDYDLLDKITEYSNQYNIPLKIKERPKTNWEDYEDDDE